MRKMVDKGGGDVLFCIHRRVRGTGTERNRTNLDFGFRVLIGVTFFGYLNITYILAFTVSTP